MFKHHFQSPVPALGVMSNAHSRQAPGCCRPPAVSFPWAYGLTCEHLSPRPSNFVPWGASRSQTRGCGRSDHSSFSLLLLSSFLGGCVRQCCQLQSSYFWSSGDRHESAWRFPKLWPAGSCIRPHNNWKSKDQKHHYVFRTIPGSYVPEVYFDLVKMKVVNLNVLCPFISCRLKMITEM